MTQWPELAPALSTCARCVSMSFAVFGPVTWILAQFAKNLTACFLATHSFQTPYFYFRLSVTSAITHFSQKGNTFWRMEPVLRSLYCWLMHAPKRDYLRQMTRQIYADAVSPQATSTSRSAELIASPRPFLAPTAVSALTRRKLANFL